jgi:hypothetical protein
MLVTLGLVGLAAGVLYLAAKRAADMGGTVMDAINPTSPQNIFYGAANAFVPDPQGVGETLGTYTYGVFNDNRLANDNPVMKKAMSSAAPANNVFYGGVNAIVQKNTGTDATLGTWLYDFFNPGK